MAEEKHAFYVVKKGDVVGIYKSFSDIQPLLASSSVSGDSLNVYKGFSLPQKTEEYLFSHGLKGASYSISAADVHEGLFGKLFACPYQDPYSSGRPLVVNCSSNSMQGATQFNANDPYSSGRRPLVVNCSSNSSQGATQFDSNNPCSPGRRPLVVNYSPKSSQGATQFDANDPYSSRRRPLVIYYSSKSSQGAMPFDANEGAGSSSFSTNLQSYHVIGGFEAELSTCLSCTLEFDGASKGNPGPAGAGAILRAEDGSKVYRLREGVGTQTNNVAEYRALILGLKHAIKKGYKHVHAQGDSLLVCNQVQGLWKIKNQNMGYLCNEAKELKDKFLSFRINHVPREYNSEADVQANLAINLQAGQVEEDCQLG